MATIGSMAIRVLAVNQVAQGLRKTEQDLNRFRKRTQGQMAGAFALPSLGTLGAGLGFAGIMREVERFNQEMANSLSVMSGVTPQIRQQLVDTAHQVAFQTKFSATEAAEAYFHLASAGLDAAQSMKALPAVARFAQAGMFNLERATELAVTAQSTMGLISQDAEQNLANLVRVTDVLNVANNVATGSTEQFAAALNNKSGAAFRAVGKDIEECVAALAVYHKQGTQGEEAGTQLAIVMRDLQTKAIENADAFKKAGVNVFDASGDMQNFADIVGDLEDHLNGLSDKAKKSELLKLGFTDKSVGSLQVILGMSDQIRQFEARMRSATGVTAQQAAKNITAFTLSMNRLKATVFAVAQTFGTPLLNGIARAIDLVVSLRRVLVPLAIGLIAVKVATMAWAAATRAAAIAQLFLAGAKGGKAAIAALAVGIGAAAVAAWQLDAALKNLGVDFEAVKMVEEIKAMQGAIGDAIADTNALAGAMGGLSGTGAVDRRSVEGFNALQRSLQGVGNNALEQVADQFNNVADAASNAANAANNAANAINGAGHHHALPQALDRRMQMHLLRGDPLTPPTPDRRMQLHLLRGDPLTMRDHLPASMRAGDRSFVSSERATGELREINKAVQGTLDVSDPHSEDIAKSSSQAVKELRDIVSELRNNRTATIDFV